MNTNKIEIYWTLIPEDENQFENKNELGYRIKTDDFDCVVTGIYIEDSKIDSHKAMRLIAKDWAKGRDGAKPFFFNFDMMKDLSE